MNKLIFDGTKRGREPRSAVKTLGTLKIKDFSRFWKRAKKAKSPFQPLDSVDRIGSWSISAPSRFIFPPLGHFREDNQRGHRDESQVPPTYWYNDIIRFGTPA
ncbi:hypothetical protein [Coleofasciculus sp.]|uniref:hypothetical protein n=1 Tax=Coleofasciculus sp. TaxID=3100458 RepID=UPI0039F9874C